MAEHVAGAYDRDPSDGNGKWVAICTWYVWEWKYERDGWGIVAGIVVGDSRDFGDIFYGCNGDFEACEWWGWC